MTTTMLDRPTAMPPRVAHPSVEALTEAVDRLVALAETVDGWAAVDLLLALDAQVGRLTGVNARLLATVEADGLWAVEGARSVTHWFAAQSGATFARSRSLVTLSRALRDHLPRTAAAIVAGEVGVDHAQAMARLAPTSEVRREALTAPADECGEEFLLAEAKQLPADSFGRLARRWAAAADPEADERGYRRACDREFLSLAGTTGGYHVSGFLTTEHGALVNTALDAVMVASTADDRRTTQQRRAQALADLARLTLDHGLTGTGAAVRPHVAVVVDFDTLRRTLDGSPGAEGSGVSGRTGRRLPFRLAPVADVERFAVAEVLGAGPIPRSVLTRLACDSEVSRIVFGPDSQVINVGRAERTFSGPRRRAVIARDGHCRYPGCTAPPALGEVHHVAEWTKDHGDTHVNLGILLCWHHHDLVHRLHIGIRRSPTGGWLFLGRHSPPVTGAV